MISSLVSYVVRNEVGGARCFLLAVYGQFVQERLPS